MAAKSQLSVLLLVALAAAILQCSIAKNTHTVGGNLGWTIPPSSSDYANWAATQKFVVGDVLVFNFANGAHDVAEVTKADYDSCNAANPISRISSGPASFTLNSTGEHFYICSFVGHCDAGQKLVIAVSAATPSTASPAPRAATPPRGPVTYTVGDSMGWTITPGGEADYQTWANNKTFLVGDVLVFNFISGTHDVAEVTKTAFGSCNTAAPLSLSSNPPVRITLTTTGQHFFTCSFPGHCSAGQKLFINVNSASSPPPSVAAPPPGKAAPPLSPHSATPPPPGKAAPPFSPQSAPAPHAIAPPPGSPSPKLPPGSAPVPSFAAPPPGKASPVPSIAMSPPPSGSTPPTSAHSPGIAPAPISTGSSPRSLQNGVSFSFAILSIVVGLFHLSNLI